jgi:enamine deaminase RidA (YjgF/YER057c/UK114 family)
VYLNNLTGGEGPGDGLDFSAQAADMFARAEAILQRESISFPQVLRTWVYVNNIDRDYAALNNVRTAFFQKHGVSRLPASTGIQGATYPRERACAMDVYTLVGKKPVQAEAMHAPTMNEAACYGSSFSRGMKVIREDSIALYVSGTASIDANGNIAHVGSLEGQAHRMLQNVEELLAGEGARLSDLVAAITYLKEPRLLDGFLTVCEDRAVPMNIPNTISVADVCRPEWLCEIEGIAICPKRS